MTESRAAEEHAPQAAVTEAVVDREAGLHRGLSARQVAMIGLGCTIGTGLFLGSAISVKLAGPAVIVSFLLGALITVPVMWALAEMAAAHPAAGSFGLYAEMYLHPWAGFAIRYTYWLCLVFVIGSEVVAAGIYCKHWWPGVPSWIWIAGFSLALLWVNTISIKSFGTFEFWFAMIKVVTIFAFLILGAMLLFGVGFPRIGAANYTAHGGFLPNGWGGVGLGLTMAIFSFLGLEIVGATAGEAADPAVAVPRALRRTLATLVLFYVGGLAVVVGIVPWNELGLGESPFVRVLRTVGIPGADHLMNFVVLTAALSSAMCNLYFTSRLLFSLARGGYAPVVLGKLSKRGMPVPAVMASGVGLLVALVLSRFFENTAFVFMIGVAFFGGPFVWIMILATHLAFRRANGHAGKKILRFAPSGPWSSLFGLFALLGVLISTWWVPGFRITMEAGPVWLVFLTACYLIWSRVAREKANP
ncbi:MAG TPA: amino acid permease [Candidatus Acidoferrum sp.]|jgi:L-asparagine transporter-like permease